MGRIQRDPRRSQATSREHEHTHDSLQPFRSKRMTTATDANDQMHPVVAPEDLLVIAQEDLVGVTRGVALGTPVESRTT